MQNILIHCWSLGVLPCQFHSWTPVPHLCDHTTFTTFTASSPLTCVDFSEDLAAQLLKAAPQGPSLPSAALLHALLYRRHYFLKVRLDVLAHVLSRKHTTRAQVNIGINSKEVSG